MASQSCTDHENATGTIYALGSKIKNADADTNCR